MDQRNFPSEDQFLRIFGEADLGEFSPSIEWHVRAVTPYGLAPSVQKILELEGASVDEYEAARKELLAACKERWLEI